MTRFEPNRYYRTSDPELGVVGTRGTLAHWRHRRVGPRYSKFGNRILYRGSDLNAFIDEHVVDPTARSTVEQRSERPCDDPT